jgi:glycerophosphoryl diester phosphodiesterase
MDIIAHRGASSLAPENTILAIQKALDMRAVWIEIDCRLTKDRRVVVFHDDSLGRMAQTTAIPINSLTYKELSAYEIGLGERIPLLADVLARIDNKSWLIIEIKETNMIPELAAVIQSSGMIDRVAITSFLVSEIALFLKNMPQVPVSLNMKDTSVATQEMHQRYGITEFNIARRYAAEQWIQEQRKNKFFTRVFTVDDPREAAQFALWGVGGIFTNRPQDFLPAGTKALRHKGTKKT